MRERERRCREGSHSHFAPPPAAVGWGRCRKDLSAVPHSHTSYHPRPQSARSGCVRRKRAKVHGARLCPGAAPENVHSGPARTQWRVEDIRTSADTATNIGEHMPRGAGRRVIKRATCHCMMHVFANILRRTTRRTGTSNLANREKKGSDRAFFRVDPGCGLVGLKPGWPGGPRPGEF